MISLTRFTTAPHETGPPSWVGENYIYTLYIHLLLISQAGVHVLTTLNCAVINIDMNVSSQWADLNAFRYTLRKGRTQWNCRSIFSLCRISTMILVVVMLIYIITRRKKVPRFLVSTCFSYTLWFLLWLESKGISV